MVIYMRHAQHGTKVATSEDEALHDEAVGWQRYRLGHTLDIKPTEGPIVAAEVQRRGPGRPRKDAA